ncbi:MAG: hypothetical protein KIS67_15150 [Verrucomicrobiae bacterium]|nr:hypothetical protein [Verrucomicrobiae bacterium]
MRLLIPRDRDHGWELIVRACSEVGVEHQLFDIYGSDWIKQAKAARADGCIYRAEFRHAPWRELFFERIRFLACNLGLPLYPRMHELELYESKRRMAYWLQAHAIPHPRTWVFGNKDEARDFLDRAPYPLIFKTDFGNASYGVRKIRNRTEAQRLWRRSFGNGYRVPYYREGTLDAVNRFKAVVRPFYRRVKGIRHLPRDLELDVMLFQEEVPIRHEWRLMKVGDSYFGKEKAMGHHGFHSGSDQMCWNIPPMQVFDLARQVCTLGDFSTMSLDIFESDSGQFLVNELQTFFGSFNLKNQMYREEAGRWVGFRRYYDETAQAWREELGEFCQNYCFNLRVLDFVKLLSVASGVPANECRASTPAATPLEN